MRRLGWRFLALVLSLSLLLGLAGYALAAQPEGRPTRVIVVFGEGVGAPGRAEAARAAGAAVIKDLPMINGMALNASSAAQMALTARFDVVGIGPDAVLSIQAKPIKPDKPKPPPAPDPQPAEQLPWGVDRIDAELAWAGNTGAGVKVAVLDTGIDPSHPDLIIAGGVNTINPRKSWADDNGHGTHVAGTVAALDNTIGVVGVAPGVALYAVKVLNRSGTGYTSDIIEGLKWCVDNGVQVVNMSFAAPSPPFGLDISIKAAYDAGIVLVAAAGNSGPGDNTVEYPARYLEVIAVSATDQGDIIAGFSSRGPEVELAAPGVDILSTYKGASYAWGSGTSMASPHVAGTAALVVWAHPGYTPSQVRGVMQLVADDLGTVGLDGLYGHGLVDAEESSAP